MIARYAGLLYQAFASSMYDTALGRRPENGLTRVLSKEFGPRKIRVNALNPGGTETEGAHAAGVMGTEYKRQIIASTSLGRVGQPEDIARVAVFLASDDAGWLTGETIFANGGHK